ncbi:MAG: F0F1 ATP synthase subunit B' [Rhodospirillales bacterium]|nr:F0F1 ATP synthase subunit B' [Rhodospirillales bacterium]
MPQFDPAVWPPQIFWLVVSFVLLYVLMARVALPRVASVLEDREFRINESLRKAEALRKQAEEAASEYEKLMADARSKAQEQLHTARERAEAEATARHAQLQERLAKQVEDAETRIEAARGEAVANIREVAIAITGAAVERLIGEASDKRSVTSAVNAVLGGKS